MHAGSSISMLDVFFLTFQETTPLIKVTRPLVPGGIPKAIKQLIIVH